MDNKVWSQIKRALKITVDYFVALIIFGVFSSIVFSLFKENFETGITIFSVIVFLLMTAMMYSDMRDTAFREKRPQYNINPPPYKGFKYGFIAVLPILLIQLVYYLVNVPAELTTFKRRMLQAFTAPLYWLAKLISHDEWSYHVVLLIIPVIAGLGYLAGFHNFYITKKLKIFEKLKKQPQNAKKDVKARYRK
ncbi:hypothetical protein ODU73_002587 [Thermoclostridium stercorarium]|uniref:hypothetical protein n=1 Tax=Thermoclostridium stercorarium TaxID=1510 RepID=UPI002248FDFC|nr:hypothetical protein [Thermoclostridium stercorarium]UZQ85444.1 hypothetical protein ODU73_002587 [Thermoclostridium stercorarium]